MQERQIGDTGIAAEGDAWDGGNQIKLDGAEYIVVRAYDILAKW
jgi:co-chaperonin GroES (HSP10)